MKKIRAIIVDDEPKGVEVLKTLIEINCPEIEIIRTATSVEQAIEYTEHLIPELIFLDIQMPIQNGFDFLKHFSSNLNFEVIFVTSYDEYAINAIKYSALDYLMKPVEISELKAAVEKASIRINEKRSTSIMIESLIQNIYNSDTEKNIIVHGNDKVNIVRLNEIEYITSDGRYCKIFLTSGTDLMIAKNLKEFENPNDQSSPLLRINKTTMINTNFLKSYSKGEPCIIEMNSGITFDVSRRRKQEILQKLKQKA